MLKKYQPVSTDPSDSRIGNRQWMRSGESRFPRPTHLSAQDTAIVSSNGRAAPSLVLLDQPWQPLQGHADEFTTPGSIESWRLLLKQLSTIVGSEGSAAIFFHSIGQLCNQYPALRTLSPQHSWPEQLAVVQNTLQQLPQSSAAFARQSLWFRGCQLITKLLGFPLSQRLLHQVATAQSTYQHV